MSSPCPICKGNQNERKSELDHSSVNEEPENEKQRLTRSVPNDNDDYDSNGSGEDDYESESEHSWKADDEAPNNDDHEEHNVEDPNNDDQKENDDEGIPSIQTYSARRRYNGGGGRSNRFDSRHDSRHRYDSRQGSHQRHSSNHSRHRMHMSRITMPSGDVSSISDPNVPGWKCGRKSKLITIHRTGRTGRREYELVRNEMEKTKMSIPDCANRGGCFKNYKIDKIQKIINGCLWKRYQDQKRDIEREAKTANERLLFHGSTKIWDIVGKGFDERYSAQTGVFGAGLYFAHNSSGSNEFVFGYVGRQGCPVHNDKGCTICKRKILLCRVILGKEHKQDGGGQFAHAPIGHHSVVGKHTPSMYTEYVVYRGEQIYPEYVITYTIVK